MWIITYETIRLCLSSTVVDRSLYVHVAVGVLYCLVWLAFGHNNWPFRNCQSWSFITVHGQFYSNRLGLYCWVTIWPRKHQRKTPSQDQSKSSALGGVWNFAERCKNVSTEGLIGLQMLRQMWENITYAHRHPSYWFKWWCAL